MTTVQVVKPSDLALERKKALENAQVEATKVAQTKTTAPESIELTKLKNELAPIMSELKTERAKVIELRKKRNEIRKQIKELKKVKHAKNKAKATAPVKTTTEK